MTLVRFNNREFLPGKRAHNGMDDMFNWFMNEMPERGSCNNYPSSNIRESDDNFSIEMLVPGLTKDELKIQVENGILNVSHEEKDIEHDEKDSYISREFHTRGFLRKFKLSDRLNSEKIKAKYDNGILSILIPKKEEAKAKPIREISIA